MVRDRWLAHVHRLGRPGEAAGLDDGDEDFQLIQIDHGGSQTCTSAGDSSPSWKLGFLPSIRPMPSTMTTISRPSARPADRRDDRVDDPDDDGTCGLERVLDGVQDVDREVPADLAEVHQHEVTADPQHGDGAEDADEAEDRGHRAHDPGAGVAHALYGVLRHLQADVVDLHQQRDSAVHDAGHQQGDHGEDRQRRPDVEAVLPGSRGR